MVLGVVRRCLGLKYCWMVFGCHSMALGVVRWVWCYWMVLDVVSACWVVSGAVANALPPVVSPCHPPTPLPMLFCLIYMGRWDL